MVLSTGIIIPVKISTQSICIRKKNLVLWQHKINLSTNNIFNLIIKNHNVNYLHIHLYINIVMKLVGFGYF